VIWCFFKPHGWLRAVLPGLIVLFTPCFAEAVTLLWDRNPETNVVGYRVYSGRVSRGYDSVLDMGNSISASVPTTPGMNYFAVTAYDRDGLESGFSAEVTYADGIANIPPVAAADNYSTPKNTALNVAATGVLANDSDADGQPLSAVLVTGPANGTLTLNANGGFTYLPAANYTGADSFTYQCSDGLAASPITTVSITVTTPPPGNRAPVAQNDTYTVAKDTALNVSGSGVLANDTDPDGQPLTATLVSAPNNGVFNLNASGSFSYTPLNQFVGTDTFQYRASDGLTSSIATVTITVTGLVSPNTPPVPQPDSYVVAMNGTLIVSPAAGVIANDFDADGDVLSVVQYGPASRGDVILYADGSLTYTPTNNFTGTDSFGYRLLDGLAISAPVTVTITITGAPPANTAPVAQADTYGVRKNGTLNMAAPGVLANDTDANGHPLTTVLVSGPANGSLALNANGSFTFTPAAGFTGNSSFTYRANDGALNSANTTVTLSVTNTAPVAQADSYETLKNIGLTIAPAAGLLNNDSDANGDALTASVVAAPAHGSLALNANGSFTFTPAANYVGADSFTYRAGDGSAFSATTLVLLTIANSNAVPVAVAESYSLAKNLPLTVAASGVLANDSDADGQPLTASLVTSPARGAITLNANGSFTFTPTAGYTGSDSFIYRASDGTTNSANTTVNLSITNTPPAAVADSYVTLKNIGLTVAAPGVLNNDSDANGDALTVSLVTSPARGALTLNANGSFTFMPAANYVGADSFTYRASDGTAFSAAATVTLTINSSNAAPVAVTDSYALAKNSPLTIAAAGVLANDSDVDGQPLTALLVSGPANGSLTLSANGSFTFTPTAGFAGSDSFTYRASDGVTNSATATVNLSITNTPPAASADSYVTLKNIGLTIAAPGVLNNDTDANGDALTVSLVTSPARGALTLNANGSFTFMPAANYVGADSFTYRVSDGTAFSTATTVALTINNSNAAPVAVANSYSLAKNLPLTVGAAAGVLANDSDVDGNPLTAALVSGPANGVLTLNANGSFTFTPAAGFAGADSFVYRANDSSLNSANTTVTLSITNSAPVANSDSFVTLKNIGLNVAAPGLLADDTDANGDALTASVVTAPANGSLNLNANGGFTFTPTANYVGADSFTYRVSDGSAFSAPATVSLTINNSNGAPVAVADSYSMMKSAPLTVPAAGVLANDSDPDGNPLVAVLVSGPTQGALTLNANGSFTFTPAANYVGSDSFTYRASDGSSNSASTTVTLSMTNTAPVAQPESYVTAKNVALTVAASGVLANDSDADGHALTAALVSSPANGALTLNANGSFTFTPTTGYTGGDSFVYRANDGAANSANITVSISITNTAPVAQPNAYATSKNIGLNIPAALGVLADDTDANGDALTASVVTAPAQGTLTLNANGSFTFTPTANYTGADSFTYRASDGVAFSANTTVTLTINNSNGAPVVVADSFALAKNTPLTVAASGVLANDSDPDGDALAAVLVSGPTRGVLNLNANGGFTFTPNANYVGADSFTYRATDGSANSANTTVTLSITNTAPVANPENYSTAKNLPLVVPASGVLANDTDAEDNALTAALVGSATGGSVLLSANGGFTFTPAAGFTGTATFTYRANDGTANSANATVSIAVTNIAPVAQPDSYATSKNISLSILGTGVLANDSDANSDALTASVVTTPVHGTLALNANGRFTFTPAANYTGLDSFTYRASDGAAFSAPVTVTITINNSNGAPVVVAESFSLAKNTPLTVAAAGVLANDSDPDGDAMTAALVSGPAQGVLNLSENGGFTFTPTAGYAGGDSFVYRASDGSASSVNVTVTLSITNNAPVAQPDSYVTAKNIGLTVAAAAGVLNNDTDANGDALTASVVAAPTRGSVTLNANGSFTFTPTANYVGADSFTYRVNDGTAFSAATTVSLMINSSNGAPVAVADNFTLAKNSTLLVPAFGVLANDSDPDGEILAATLVSGPTRGVLTFNANGSFSYAPTTGYVGSDSFTYRAQDGALNFANATVTLSITNTPPVAQPDSYTTPKNIGLTIAAPGLLANDTDANGDVLTASLETAPPHGTLELNDDGSFTFTPTANHSGSGTFTYRVNDGTAFSAPATVTIAILNSNTAPVAVADSYSTPRNTKLTVGEVAGLLVNDSDVDADALTAVLVSPPARGTLVLSADGSLTYTPTNNFSGQDSFAYRAHDGTSNSAITTVTLTVLPPPNVAPVARNENYVVVRNATLNVAPAGVLANDTDADGNVLTAVLAAAPSRGTVTLNANGGFSYTPMANYTGADTFTYRANDGLTNSGLATVFLSVQPQVNTPPVARGESYFTVRGVPLNVSASVGVLANDTDADGTALTVSLVVPVANGTLVLAPGGSFLYTPRAGFTGLDGFSYRVSDGVATATAVATIRVNEPPTANVAPVATVDRYEGIKNETMVIEAHSGVLVNDTDANVDSLTATLVSNPAHGTLLFNEDGSFIYFPDVNFTGADSFGYFASDGTNISATVQVTLAINEPPPVNTPPVAQPESFAAWKNTPLYVSWISGVLKNDSDADGDTLTASLVTPPAQGTVTLNWNGGFVFTPPQDFTGTVQFAYEAEDGLDSSETTLVTITVSEQVQTNAVPIATSDTYFTTKNTPLDVPATSGVLINDRDADDAVFFAGLYLPPSHGTVALNLDGSFTYTPAAEYTGTDTFAYEVSDGLDVSAPTLVTITITGNAPTLAGCQNCFAELDEVMAQRNAVFANAIKARLAVPTNAACAQYGVLVFRTMTPQLGPLHDSAANRALASAGACVAEALAGDLVLRFNRASSLAPSKYTTGASNYLDSIVTSLASMTAASNNSSRSKLLAAAANAFVRADKMLAAGDLALPALEGRQLTCTFVKSGQTSRGTFVFGATTFIVEDSNGVPIKTGTYNYTRTAWNGGRLQLAFDQPTLGYQAGVTATWTFTYGRARHKISAAGLRGYFTSP